MPMPTAEQLNRLFTTNAAIAREVLNRGPNVGYVIPIYQREFSWPAENIDKFVFDLLAGVKRQISAGDSSPETLFLGTVIVARADPLSYVSGGRDEVVREAYSIIDGQQRLTTLALLAAALAKKLRDLKQTADTNSWQEDSTLEELSREIDSVLTNLIEMYTVDSHMGTSKPKKKPLIIREQPSANTDKWTRDQNPTHHYFSDLASYLSDLILEQDPGAEFSSARRPLRSRSLDEAITCIDRWVEEIYSGSERSDEYLPVEELNQNPYLIKNRTNLATAIDDQSAFEDEIRAAIRLAAVSRFMTESCALVQITTADDKIGLDIFQSLNGTGTPLTAFEVFEPHVVSKVNSEEPDSYRESDLATLFGNISKSLDGRDKSKLTDEIILKFSMAHSCASFPKKYSHQRDWLETTFDGLDSSNKKEEFIRQISHTTDYWCNFGEIPRLPNQNATSFPLARSLEGYFGRGTLTDEEYDTAAMCLYFIKKSGFDRVHSILSIFFSNVVSLKNQGQPHAPAAKDFLSACKSCVAFLVLFRGGTSDWPDREIQNLFDSSKFFSWSSDRTNQNVAFLGQHFREVLERKEIYDQTNPNDSKRNWVDKAFIELNYEKSREVCRFALLVAADGRVADTTAGKEGLTQISSVGPPFDYLNCKRFFSADTATIEHIANQTKPDPILYPDHMDHDLYPHTGEIVHKLGNLTLLSKATNSSAGREWPNKLLYYVALTTETASNDFNLQRIESNLPMPNIPPALSGITSTTPYQPHLAPICHLGYQTGNVWTKNFVERRTRHLCEIIFDKLNSWL